LGPAPAVSMNSTRVTLQIPSSRLDELVAELWALGTSGLEVLEEGSETLLQAYFAVGSEPSRADVEAVALQCDARVLETRSVEDRDWLADYRAGCAPITIGSLVIDPREPDQGEEASLTGPLRIPARNAFGTGSHESTRLILEALIETELAGRSVLDVGTGSAILALAALRRGAGRVVGFDIDFGSVVTARDNARLNGSNPSLFAGTVRCLAGEFDLILVNILPHRWLAEAPDVVSRLRVGGQLLVSGLLAKEARAVLTSLGALGLRLDSRREAGEWCSLRLRRLPR